MRAIVHIGTEKTGTTSFQAFMSNNREQLRNHGILYPERLGPHSHRHFASYALAMEGELDPVPHLGRNFNGGQSDFCRVIKHRLSKQITEARAAGLHTAVISSEHLHSRLRTVEHVEHIHALVAPLFDEIEVHVHLRPQVDVLTSLASTKSRVGGTVRQEFFDGASSDQLYYNYDLLVAAWEQVFGVENVHCLPFATTPDFLGFIAARIGLDIAEFEKPLRINEALDVRVMAMINALNDGGTDQRVDFRVLDNLPVEQKLKFDRSMAKSVQSRFAESNRKLAERRDDIQAEHLEPNWDSFPEQGNLHILGSACVFSGMFAELIGHYNQIIGELKQQPVTAA